MARSLPAFAFGLLSAAAFAVGVWSLRYVLPGMPAAASLDNLSSDRTAFLVHAVSASVALLLGPLQFIGALRRRPGLHRAVGWGTVTAVMVAWGSSIPMAMHAQAGTIASAGFLVLGLSWGATTTLGVLRARQRRFSGHRRWMVRSFALTAAAVSLRLELGFISVVGIPFEQGYPVIAWACWIPNLVVAEWLLRRGDPPAIRTPGGVPAVQG